MSLQGGCASGARLPDGQAQTRKKQTKQKIIAVLIVTFMLTMVFGTLDLPFGLAANQSLSNLIQNFVGGELSMEAPSSLGFNNLSVGVAANSLANMDYVNFRDYRGSGAGWSVSATMNNMFTSEAGTRNYLLNGNIAWFPQTAVLTGLEGSSTSGIAKGSDGLFDAARTLVNTSTNNGMGNYRLNSLNLNVQYYGWGDQKAGTYQNTLTMTIS